MVNMHELNQAEKSMEILGIKLLKLYNINGNR